MTGNYLLGMDCGTTNIKAVILSEDGKLCAESSRPSRFISPGQGMQEQDANEWWKNACAIFKELTTKVGPEIASRIRGISVSSHTVSLLPLDKNGKTIRNAITYQDCRASKQAEYITEQIGHDRYVEIIGGQPSVAFLAGKLLWYKENEKENFAKTKYLLQASSYINYKLTGEFTSDEDQAVRTQCFDINKMEWSEDVSKAMGFDLNTILPKAVPVDHIIGEVTKEAEAKTGLKAGIPVVAGCSDAMASLYATGISRMGEAGESSGTTSLVFVGSDKMSAPDIPVVTKPCGIEGVPFVFDAPIQTSGAAIKWFIDYMALNEKKEAEAKGVNIYEYLNQIALNADAGCKGLMFFPYLLGERAPLWNDYARAMFIGLGMETTRGQLTRSIFEGTAFALRHVLETVKESGGEADCIRICGGGSKSRTWSMIKASMLNIPVIVLDGNSGDVPVGDCMLVGTKLGVFSSITEASLKAIKVKEVIDPDKEWVKIYSEMYPLYVDMYKNLDNNLKSLREIF